MNDTVKDAGAITHCTGDETNMAKQANQEIEEEIIDYDLSSDAEWMDDYDEMRCGYL